MQCKQLKKGYTQCKRGMVDMRKRFRGNQPIAVSQELEAGGGGGQLYGGRPAVAEVKVSKEEVEENDGEER